MFIVNFKKTFIVSKVKCQEHKLIKCPKEFNLLIKI
jgi:hypothetical protein